MSASAFSRVSLSPERLCRRSSNCSAADSVALRSALREVCSFFSSCNSPEATSSSYLAEASERLSSSTLAERASLSRARSPRCACSLSSSLRRERMPAFFDELPPVIEPPECMSCPSNVTILALPRERREIAIASVSVSATSVRPSRFSTMFL